jgi:extracellular elastinolytic metalloproteinase
VVGSDATGQHDLDVYLYDASCSLMEPYITDGADPSGPILPGAKWAVVSLFAGANASFKLTGTATITL